MFIDCHAHLCVSEFSGDLGEVVDRAKGLGVLGCVVVTESEEEYGRALELSEKYSGWVYPCVGLFPTHLDESSFLSFERSLRENRGWCGIGEVGLDRWLIQDERERCIQEDIFRRIVCLAVEFDLCLNVHSRSSGRYVLDILSQEGASRVHLHAFDAKLSTVKLGLDLGYKFSIPTSVVHSPQKQKLAKYLPLDAILLETDSPVLGVDRERRNEPSEIVKAFDMVCALRCEDRDVLMESIYCNSVLLYGFGGKEKDSVDIRRLS